MVTTSIREWPVRAQQAARRNAMVAATAATARRAERDDVAAFMRDRDPEPPAADAERQAR